MKVNVFGILMKLMAICAVSNFVILSAAVPLSDPVFDEQISEAPPTTAANTTGSNEVVINATTTAPLTSENASIEGSTSSDTLPPIEFPTDDDKILPKNDTALKILQSVSSQNVNSSEESKSNETSAELTPIDSSSPDNVTSTVAPPATTEQLTNSSSITPSETPEEDYDSISNENEKSDTENVQETPEEPQQELEEEFGKNASDKATINLEEPVTNEPVFHSGHFALIFASILIVFSVVAYVGLVLWRSRLESRYGMRQRLVTEDDYYNNNNDVRYFGL